MTATTDITLCTETDAAEWDRFVNNSGTGNFYQRYGWARVNARQFGHTSHYLVARQQGSITGVLPITEIRSPLFGHILCSLPFVNFGGPCTGDAVTEQALIRHAQRLTHDLGADYLELRATHQLDADLPASTQKVSMTLALNPDPDVLWNAFESKHRTNIRRVYKNGLTVSSGGREHLDVFYHLLAQSWRNLGTPIYRKQYFAALFDEFGDALRLFVCHANGQPIAAAFNGHHGGTVEGMWAGALPEARKLQASYVLYWEMIKDACERGYQRFHLGRSSVDSGGEQFKKKWNAEQIQLYWHFHLGKRPSLPELNVSNPKYQLAIKMWRKLPLSVTTTLGPWIARGIP